MRRPFRLGQKPHTHSEEKIAFNRRPFNVEKSPRKKELNLPRPQELRRKPDDASNMSMINFRPQFAAPQEMTQVLKADPFSNLRKSVAGVAQSERPVTIAPLNTAQRTMQPLEFEYRKGRH